MEKITGRRARQAALKTEAALGVYLCVLLDSRVYRVVFIGSALYCINANNYTRPSSRLLPPAYSNRGIPGFSASLERIPKCNLRTIPRNTR